MNETKIKISNNTVKVELQPLTSGGMSLGLDLSGKLGLLPDSGEFNGNRTVTRPGLPSVNPGGTTVGEFLNNYFFPAVPPSCSLSASNPVRQFGSSTAVTLSYSVTRGTNVIAGIIVNGTTVTPLSGTLNTTTAPNVDRTFNMLVTDGDLDNIATATVSYRHYRYWFTSDENLLEASEFDISELLHDATNREFATSRGQERGFNLANEYIYFAYPQIFGVASFLVGGLPNTAYISRVFNYINSDGYAQSYILYRSGGRGSGTITVALQ